MPKRAPRGAAVLTGAAGGIGSAIAQRFAVGGVPTVGLDVVAAEQVDLAVVGDVADEADVVRARDLALDRYGTIDHLVCAAGSTTRSRLTALSIEEWRRVIDSSLTGTFLAIRSMAPVMEAQGWGRIVVISSGHAVKGCRFGAHDAAAKAGVIALAKSAALELGASGITVNVVAPGPIDTPMLEGIGGVSPDVMASIPTGRVGVPDDVAHAVEFLVSGDASYITGHTLHVNGGLHMV